jgi:hypothetical protein
MKGLLHQRLNIDFNLLEAYDPTIIVILKMEKIITLKVPLI